MKATESLQRSSIDSGFNWREHPKLSQIHLSNYSVVSIDVFDTLIFRAAASVDEIFEEVAEVLRDRGILGAEIDNGNFVLLRSLSQQRSYQALSDGATDPSLLQIYRSIPSLASCAEAAAAIEVEVECRYTIANPFVTALMREARSEGKQILLLSDMYLDAGQIEKILTSCNIPPTDYDKLWVSSDRDESKRHGTVYPSLLKQLPESNPGEFLHIGDNCHADYLNANAAGISAIHYDITAKGDFPREIHESLYSEGKNSANSLRRLAGNATQCAQGESFWHQFGASVLGPFLVGFSDWVINQARQREIDLICPLMREGHLFKPLLEEAARRLGYSCTIAPLYISRRVMAEAGNGELVTRYLLDHIDRDALLVDHSSNNTVGETVARRLRDQRVIHSLLTWGHPEKIAAQKIDGLSVDAFLAEQADNHPLLELLASRGAFFEELFFGDEGSTVGYRENVSGSVFPVLDDRPVDRAISRARLEAQAGVWDFNHLWNHCFDKLSPLEHKLFDRRTLCNTLLRVIQLPTTDEAEYLSMLQIDTRGDGIPYPIVNLSKPCRESYWLEGCEVRQQGKSELSPYLTTYRGRHRLHVGFYQLCIKIRSEGLEQVLICGAGEAGIAAAEIAATCGLQVVALTDKRAELYGRLIGGAEVTDLDSGLNLRPDAILVASQAFAVEIRQQIDMRISQLADYTPLVFQLSES